MRRGFDGLAATVQATLLEDPFSGHVFVFRGRKGDRIKVLWWSGDGMCLLAKRLEHGHFVWPSAESGAVHLTPAQLSMLLVSSFGIKEPFRFRHLEATDFSAFRSQGISGI